MWIKTKLEQTWTYFSANEQKKVHDRTKMYNFTILHIYPNYTNEHEKCSVELKSKTSLFCIYPN